MKTFTKIEIIDSHGVAVDMETHLISLEKGDVLDIARITNSHVQERKNFVGEIEVKVSSQMAMILLNNNIARLYKNESQEED